MLSKDTIFDKPRDWFYRQYPPFDNPLLGFDYQQRDKHGKRLADKDDLRKPRLIGELLTCTRCLTVWTTILMSIIYWNSNNFIQIMIEVVAMMGVASILAKKI